MYDDKMTFSFESFELIQNNKLIYTKSLSWLQKIKDFFQIYVRLKKISTTRHDNIQVRWDCSFWKFVSFYSMNQDGKIYKHDVHIDNKDYTYPHPLLWRPIKVLSVHNDTRSNQF